MSGPMIFLGIVILYFLSCIKIIFEYERGVVFRLGRLLPVRGAGLRLIFWPIERLVRIDLRVITLDIPPQDTITRDNVSVKVNAVCYLRVIDANKVVNQVKDANYIYATSQLSQTTLRSVIGQVELDELLAERE
ncbi:MAG: slipin family protein, partial [Acidobacteria bacterium]|nr:slipin family protein [Acidobacteriota bacterium]